MDLGFPEILLILVIVLIIFGAGKLPQIGSSLGKAIREFKREKDRPDENLQVTNSNTKMVESKVEIEKKS